MMSKVAGKGTKNQNCLYLRYNFRGQAWGAWPDIEEVALRGYAGKEVIYRYDLLRVESAKRVIKRE